MNKERGDIIYWLGKYRVPAESDGLHRLGKRFGVVSTGFPGKALSGYVCVVDEIGEHMQDNRKYIGESLGELVRSLVGEGYSWGKFDRKNQLLVSDMTLDIHGEDERIRKVMATVGPISLENAIEFQNNFIYLSN